VNIFPDCYPCVIRQAASLSTLLDIDDSQAKKVLDTTMRMLLAATGDDSPQQIITSVFEYARTVILNGADPFDPYAELKEFSNRLVMNHFDRLEAMVMSSPSALETAIKLAAAGNIIDFGAKDHGSMDIEHEIRAIPDLRFSKYDFTPLRQSLEQARHLLYIGDNAGEIVFDRVFIRQLNRTFPQMGVVFATRDRPIINDVTMDDAIRTGLASEAQIISSGCSMPGIQLNAASAEFLELFTEADVIIAKGQGNFEGLYDLTDKRLFHILRIKCARIAQRIGAQTGDLVLLQKYQDIGGLSPVVN